MSDIKLIIGTSADYLSSQEVDAQGVNLGNAVPFTLTIDQEDYRDGQTELTPQQINQRIAASSPGNRSTACPSIQEYLAELQGAKQYLMITVGDKASAAHDFANVARDIALEDDPEAEIYVYNSQAASGEERLAVEKAIEWIQADLSFEEIVARLEKHREHSHSLTLLPNPKSLLETGRMQESSEEADYAIIRRVDQNENAFLAPYQTTTDADKLTDFVQAIRDTGFEGGRVAISHNDELELAQQVLKELQANFPDVSTDFFQLSPAVALHLSAGAVMVGFVGNKRPVE